MTPLYWATVMTIFLYREKIQLYIFGRHHKIIIPYFCVPIYKKKRFVYVEMCPTNLN